MINFVQIGAQKLWFHAHKEMELTYSSCEIYPQNSSLMGFYGKTAPWWAHWGDFICAIYEFTARKSQNRVGCKWLYLWQGAFSLELCHSSVYIFSETVYIFSDGAMVVEQNMNLSKCSTGSCRLYMEIYYHNAFIARNFSCHLHILCYCNWKC